MSDNKPQTGRSWRLIAGDEQLSRNQARRAPWVQPETLEEVWFSGPTNPRIDPTVAVFGRDAAGRLVKTELPRSLHGLTGEQAAAVRWLSGAPRAHWRRVKVNTPQAGR